MRVLALVPALDAEASVGQVVEGVRRHLPDVLVVDDGSSDHTAAEASAAGAEVIRHPENRGKGKALKTGFRFALDQGYDAVLTLDADLQHDPDDIPKLMDAARTGADIVVGARLGDRAAIPRARYWANRAGVACISWRAGCALADTQSGFRLYRSGVLRSVRLLSSRFETETEVLIRAGRRGFKIVSVPVRTIYARDAYGRSHFRPVADTARICALFLSSFFWRG